MFKRKILVTEPFSKEQVKKIEQSAGNDFEAVQIIWEKDSENAAFKAVLKEAEIVVGVPPVEVLQNPEENCPKLKFIQMTWAGADIYTQNSIPFPKEKVLLANASGAYGMTISQFVICQILSLMLNFKAYNLQQENKIWERRAPVLSLDGAKVLIYGAGDIGTMTAKRLTGFNAYTIGVCRNIFKPHEYFNELCNLSGSEKFLPDADVVVCCLPNTVETAGFMDERRLSLMKKNAIIVNVGRGNFIDNLALDKLLREGKLWGAALDVTNPEPLPIDHPLWENPRCIITPHTSGVGFGHLEATVELLCDIACENIEYYCQGRQIKNKVF